MTVEVTEQETKEEAKDEVVEKTTDELSKEMYPDQVKEEDKTETEEGNETKEEAPKEEAKEETGEQEETKDGEDSEEIKLTLSKDSPLDNAHVEKLFDFVEEKGLTQEQGQMILEREEAVVTSFAEKQKADHDASVADWAKQVENHPEYGGDKTEESVAIATRPLKKFGGEDIDTFLKDTGFGNHPAVFEYHYRLGLAMGDDNFIKGGQPPASTPKPLADRMYPDQAKKE